MGGLVSRAAMTALEEKDPDTAGLIRQVIMLGTPNYGSFAPVMVFRNTYATLKKIAALDLRNSGEELVQKVLSTFPGLYQMLPSPDRYSDINFYESSSWPQSGVKLDKNILQTCAKVQARLAKGSDRFKLIAGVNQETVVGARLKENEFYYDITLEGDGTVPLKFALVDGVKTYYINESHGNLPNNLNVTRAVIELIETGKTSALPETWEAMRRGTRTLKEEEIRTREVYEGRRGNELSQREVRHLADEFAAPQNRRKDR